MQVAMNRTNKSQMSLWGLVMGRLSPDIGVLCTEGEAPVLQPILPSIPQNK